MDKLALFGGEASCLQQQIPEKFSEDEIEAAVQVIREGTLSVFRGGTQVHSFEQEFADYIGTRHALATTSGTTALHCAVASYGFPAGSEVLVPAVTFISTASVVLQEGLHPVFVDIDEYYCMCPEDMERKITPQTRAVIPVHLYGHPAQMDAINAIAKKYGLVVIEDACQSHGAMYNGIHTGNLGDIGCFSFYQTKNMTCGEGGMLTFNDDAFFSHLCMIKENGSPRNSNTWYHYDRLGFNYNMTELQGAIGRIQLGKLEHNNNHRRSIAAVYDHVLHPFDLALPRTAANVLHARHNYPVVLGKRYAGKRDFIVDALRAEGVPVDVAYPCTLYQTALFKSNLYNKDCPKAEAMTGNMFTLFTDGAITQALAENIGISVGKVLRCLDSEIL